MTDPAEQIALVTQETLKTLLQDNTRATQLEQLASALLSRLLDLTIPIAKSGFQYGGDAGSAGRQNRHLRLETKKYSDRTPLSQRELLGEIDEAIWRDPALEVWILVTTTQVSEQLEQSLTQKGASVGVPVIIFDWKGDRLSDLAALCASAPDIVSRIFSPESWCIGPSASIAFCRCHRSYQARPASVECRLSSPPSSVSP